MSPALELVTFRIPSGPSTWSALISPEERDRAAAFHFPRDRHRFAAVRGWVRAELAERQGTRPQDLRFSFGPEGKPHLAGLEWNLTHEGDWALLVVSADGPVGVDLARSPADADDLAPVACTPTERAYLSGLPAARRPDAFGRLWSIKEALVKAWGRGLSIPPHEVETGAQGSGQCLRDGQSWSWHSWRHPSGLWAAVATRGPEFPLPFVERPAMVCAGPRDRRVA